MIHYMYMIVFGECTFLQSFIVWPLHMESNFSYLIFTTTLIRQTAA